MLLDNQSDLPALAFLGLFPEMSAAEHNQKKKYIYWVGWTDNMDVPRFSYIVGS